MKTMICCLLGLIVMTSPASMAADEPVPGIEVAYLDETPAQVERDSAVCRAINEKALPLDLSSMGLEDAIRLLAKAAGKDVIVNWPALELVGIDQDSLVTYQSGERPVAQHLEAILEMVSADAFDDDRLGFSVERGVVRVTTLRELKQSVVGRSYNIRPLLIEPYRPVGMFFSEDAFEDAVAFHAWARGERRYPMTDALMLAIYKQHVAKMQQEIDKLDPGQAVEPQPLFEQRGGLFGAADSRRAEPGEYLLPAIEELTELIQSTTAEQDAWLDEESTLEVNGDQLIIKTYPAAHAQIKSLLDMLYQAEVKKQADLLKDAYAMQLLAEANEHLRGEAYAVARAFVEKALKIKPDHVPARAMLQLLEALEPAGDRVD